MAKLNASQKRLKKIEQSFFKMFRQTRRAGSIGKAEKLLLKVYAYREHGLNELLLEHESDGLHR